MSIRTPWRCDPSPDEKPWSAGLGPAAGPGGFTLIELLVVVAVIAMLLSILLPSLGGAREQSRAVICGERLRGFGGGLGIYAAENQDWIPGINTSGVELEALKFIWNEDIGAVFRSHVPVQSWDWMTPIMAPQMELPAVRATRFRHLLDALRCPSQRYNSVLWPGGLAGSPDVQQLHDEAPWPAVSYLMPAHFQFCGRDYGGQVLASVEHEGQLEYIWTKAAPGNWEVVVNDFKPQVDRVGPPARKIFAADGTRYLDYSGLLDHDVNPLPNLFGSFATPGAWWGGSTAYGVKQNTLNWDGHPVPRGSPSQGQNLALSYRHGGQSGVPSGSAHNNHGRINAVFFDGHVARMSDRQSREIHLWYPTGAVVRCPAEGMTQVPADFVIP